MKHPCTPRQSIRAIIRGVHQLGRSKTGEWGKYAHTANYSLLWAFGLNFRAFCPQGVRFILRSKSQKLKSLRLLDTLGAIVMFHLLLSKKYVGVGLVHKLRHAWRGTFSTRISPHSLCFSSRSTFSHFAAARCLLLTCNVLWTASRCNLPLFGTCHSRFFRNYSHPHPCHAWLNLWMSPNDAGVSDTLISKVLLCFGALTKRARFVFGAATEEIVPEKGTIIFRSQNPERVRLFGTVRLFGACWYSTERLRISAHQGLSSQVPLPVLVP